MTASFIRAPYLAKLLFSAKLPPYGKMTSCVDDALLGYVALSSRWHVCQRRLGIVADLRQNHLQSQSCPLRLSCCPRPNHSCAVVVVLDELAVLGKVAAGVTTGNPLAGNALKLSL